MIASVNGQVLFYVNDKLLRLGQHLELFPQTADCNPLACEQYVPKLPILRFFLNPNKLFSFWITFQNLLSFSLKEEKVVQCG